MFLPLCTSSCPDRIIKTPQEFLLDWARNDRYSSGTLPLSAQHPRLIEFPFCPVGLHPPSPVSGLEYAGSIPTSSLSRLPSPILVATLLSSLSSSTSWRASAVIVRKTHACLLQRPHWIRTNKSTETQTGTEPPGTRSPNPILTRSAPSLETHSPPKVTHHGLADPDKPGLVRFAKRKQQSATQSINVSTTAMSPKNASITTNHPHLNNLRRSHPPRSRTGSLAITKCTNPPPRIRKIWTRTLLMATTRGDGRRGASPLVVP